MEELLTDGEEQENGGGGEEWSLWKFLFHKDSMGRRPYCWPILLVILLNACQQLCGINVVFFFADSLYKRAGLQGEEISYASLVVSAVNVISTVICVLLMDRLGRRKLLLPPMAMLCMSVVTQVVLLTISDLPEFADNKAIPWATIATFVIFVIGFAVGLAPIPNFIAAELFKTGK